MGWDGGVANDHPNCVIAAKHPSGSVFDGAAPAQGGAVRSSHDVADVVRNSISLLVTRWRKAKVSREGVDSPEFCCRLVPRVLPVEFQALLWWSSFNLLGEAQLPVRIFPLAFT